MVRPIVADDDIAIGEGVWIKIGHRGGAGRCLLSRVTQTSHFHGVRTVFDPIAEVGTAPIVTREIDARPPLVHFYAW